MVEQHSYLTLVPRGFEHTVIDILKTEENVISAAVVGDPSNIPTAETLTALFHEAQAKDAAKSRNQRRYECLEGTCCFPVGPVNLAGRKVVIGYDRSTSHEKRFVWGESGLFAGVVWLELIASATTTSLLKMGRELRCLGPLIATVHRWSNLDFPEGPVSLEQGVASIERAFNTISTDSYLTKFDAALDLWRLHVKECWDTLAEADQQLWTRTDLKYRLSFLRIDATQHQYTRVELLSSPTVFQRIVPLKYRDTWTVDLKHYDVEIILLQRANWLSLGFVVRPYQLQRIRSFTHGGLPGDSTPPLLSETPDSLVRLKPTTARALLQVARVQPAEVVYDPCCGVGTIPHEASLMGAIALGGDLILAKPAMESIAVEYWETFDLFGKQRQKKYQGSNFIALDSSRAPLRSNFVDVVVSDLPFGQQCLSSSSLEQFLPLLLAEIGRVLRCNTGRMVLLCGSYIPVLAIMKKQLGVWKLPCQSVFPVSIGGHVAFVVVCNRGSNVVHIEPSHMEKVRKLASRREMIERQQRSLPSSAKKRRAQA